jgi:hypothetical protein
VTNEGLLELVLDRLARAESADEIFGADETAEWPDGALDILTKAGLLRLAQPARVIECHGCERNCFMPVIVRPAEDNRAACAFISCDKPEDVGRVPVDMRRLQQWQTTGAMFADIVAQQLGLNGPATHPLEGNQWHVGVLKGRKLKTLVTLMAGDGLNLSLAGHTVPLSDVLAIKKNVLTIDKAELIRLADSPADNASTESPEHRRERLRARVRDARATGARAFLRVVADEEGISVSRLKQLTSQRTSSTGVWPGFPNAQKKGTRSKKTKTES